MKNLTLYLVAAVVVAANGLALVHVAQNRQTITLSERELQVRRWQETGGVAMRLQWTGAVEKDGVAPFFNEERLRGLGFDTKLPAKPEEAWRFCSRQGARTAWAAFALNEAAPEGESRLALVDVDRDRARLAARRARAALVLPVTVRMYVKGRKKTAEPQEVTGQLGEVQTMIHVPLELGTQLRTMPKYEVTLNYGRLDEPWVAAVKRP